MPLVFVNACEAGQAGFTLTGLGGWAEALHRLRAGIFIGSLWAINDELAALFAESFYNRLWGSNGRQQQSIGEAFHAARQDIKAKDPAIPRGWPTSSTAIQTAASTSTPEERSPPRTEEPKFHEASSALVGLWFFGSWWSALMYNAAP